MKATVAVWSFVIMSGCSSGMEAGDPRCLIPCAEGAAECVVASYSSYEDERAGLAACRAPTMDAVSGTCRGDGTRFLLWTDGFTGEVRFFAATGIFRGRTTLSDQRDGVCGGRAYWPVEVRCDGATVTEVLCGSFFYAGDRITW